jgi:hypothetical protein
MHMRVDTSMKRRVLILVIDVTVFPVNVASHCRRPRSEYLLL